MNESFDRYYENSILVKDRKSSKEINLVKLKLYINAGLSSVKIANKLGVSYPTILSRTDKLIPEFSNLIRENGKKNKLRISKKLVS